MKLRFRCSQGHALAVDDSQAGKKIRCPKCREVILVPEEEESGPIGLQEASEKKPTAVADLLLARPKNPKREKELGLVRSGLGIHSTRLYIFLVTPLVLLFGPALLAGGQIGQGAIVLVALLTILMLMATPILGMVGSTLCCWTPAKSKGKNLIVASLAIDAAGFLLGIVKLILAIANRASEPESTTLILLVLNVLTVVGAFVSWVLFMLFLKRLARYLEERGAANDAMSIAYVGTLLIIVPSVLLGGILGLAVILKLEAMHVVQIVLGFTAAIWLFFLLKLMFRTMELIDQLRQAITKDLESY